MIEKNVKSRIQNKHDIEANWAKAENFVPLIGEIIVYDIDENYDYERFKIGDGTTSVTGLPFADENVLEELDNMVQINLEGAVEGEANLVNADTLGSKVESELSVLNSAKLGGRLAEDYATRNFVTTKISEAQLGGDGNGDAIDLSGFATKDDVTEALNVATTAQNTADSAQTIAADAILTAGGAESIAIAAQTIANSALSLLHIDDTDTEHLISTGDDMNNYIAPGVYRCATATIAKSLSNMPIYNYAGFRLIVSETSASGGFIQIAIFNTTSDRIYYRVRAHTGNWAGWKRMVGHEYGLNEELWSGSWSDGKITIPNSSKYKAFVISLEGLGTAILAIKQGSHVRGHGGYTTDDSISDYYFNADFSGDDWTFVACYSYQNLFEQEASYIEDRVITSITGLL